MSALIRRRIVSTFVACVMAFGNAWLLPAQSQESPNKLKVALCLGGGGARGAAHVGVLRVLEQEKVPFDMVLGCSMGSVIGAWYCNGVPLSQIETYLTDGTVKEAFVPWPPYLRLLVKVLSRVILFWRERYPGLFSGNRVAEMMRKTLPQDHQNIEDAKIPFYPVVTNLLDGQSYRLEKGELAKAVQASSSLPFLLKPVEMNGNVYLDGGVRANIPTYPARGLGADVIIAVDVDEKLAVIEPSELKSVNGLANRVTTIGLTVIDEHQLAIADVVISPDLRGIGVLSKKKTDVAKAIKAGEAAARSALPEIREAIARKHAETEKKSGK